jgi:hypothetical protein
MKMLFFSSDLSEIKQANKEFVQAGIQCEIRNRPAPNGVLATNFDAELWIQNDADCHRAFLLCVQLGIGFANRTRKPSLVEH